MERRSGKDRRARPTSPLSLASLMGRRRHARRREDRRVYVYVDRYGWRSVFAVVSTLILCIADAFLTLTLLQRGAMEANPVMDFFIGLGPLPFLLVKYILTAFGLGTLLIHKNLAIFRGRLPVKTLLLALPVLYGILIAYELFLATFV
ncbi:MAG: DUF5658 family protein [Thermodesulfobacteriota bacterium]|nr:DUF5658 family protein [Thermodesulfobacteriota bacterium]